MFFSKYKQIMHFRHPSYPSISALLEKRWFWDTPYHVPNHIKDCLWNSMELKGFLSCWLYHKVSSFLFPASSHTCSLQYRLALSVSDANVNMHRPYYVQNSRALFLIATFLIGPSVHVSNITSYRTQIWISSVVAPFLEIWVRRKRERVLFSDAAWVPRHTGDTCWCIKDIRKCILHDRSPLI